MYFFHGYAVAKSLSTVSMVYPSEQQLGIVWVVPSELRLRLRPQYD